jgi:hypothetical protein
VVKAKTFSTDQKNIFLVLVKQFHFFLSISWVAQAIRGGSAKHKLQEKNYIEGVAKLLPMP